MRCAADPIFLELKLEVKAKVKMAQNSMRHFQASKCTHKPNLGFLAQIEKEICSTPDFSRTKARAQGHNDPETVPQDVSTPKGTCIKRLF